MSFPSVSVLSFSRRGGGPPVTVTAAAILVAAGVMLPPVYLVLRTANAGETAWDVITRSRTLDLLIDTAALAIGVSAAAVVISLPLAWLTTRSDLPLRSFWTIVLSLPLVFPSYVAAFALVAALGPRGLIQDLLEPLGVSTLPELYGYWGAWLVLTLITYPYVFLSLRAGFQGLDRSLEEAARSLGQSPWLTFLRVTLPSLRPSIAAGSILVALYTLSDFGAVSILRFNSLTSAIFIQYKSSFDRSSAAALALVLVALALLVVFLESATRGKGAYHSRNRRPARLVPLGGWRWPALAFCGGVASVGVVLPLLVIVYWAVKGLTASGQVDLNEGAAFNSISASTLAAIATLGAALPIAHLSARHPGWLSSILEKATYCGFALPGITIALSLVFFAANYAPAVYQTLALLIFAYVVRFLPEAVGACRSAMLQVNPNTEEAGRGLGAGPAKVFLRVTAPQILPGMSAGFLLVFLTAMKELPITLLLSPIGFETLATEIWSATSEAFFARAALPSLVLVGLSAIAVFLMLQREKRVS